MEVGDVLGVLVAIQSQAGNARPLELLEDLQVDISRGHKKSLRTRLLFIKLNPFS